MENKSLHQNPALSPRQLASLAVRYAGKRLLRHEIHLDEATLHLLLSRKHFRKTPSIQHRLFDSLCTRCGNRKRSLMGYIPCQNCHKRHLYCRNCIQMGRVMECEVFYEWLTPQPEWEIYTDACTWIGNLTVQQQFAAGEMKRAIQHAPRNILTWAVCGAGKTEMLYPGIEEALNQGKRICLATPRSDVVRELLPRIKAAFKGVHIQGLYGGSNDKDGTAELIISTTHQLLRYKNAFDVMIIDEVDAFPYHADPSLVYATNQALKQTHTIIYLTATPRKEYKHQMKIKKLPYVFVPTRFHGHPLPVPILKMCFSLQNNLRKEQPPNAFFQWIQKRRSEERQVLLFVPTIKLAKSMTAYLKKILMEMHIIRNPMSITSVHAEDEQREEKVNRFRSNEIELLITTTILERGVTFPSIDVAIIDAGHQVFDEAALVQIAGRAGRSAKDPTGDVIFFHSGKTRAMVDAIQSINEMNKRGGLV